MQRLLNELDQIARLHAAQQDFQKSIALLAALKAGELSLDQVVLSGDGWSLVAPPVIHSGPIQQAWLVPEEPDPAEVPVDAVEDNSGIVTATERTD